MTILSHPKMSIKIALAGNPNSGKTTLFNTLTGSNQYVGNWPGVTVEKKEGKLKDNEDVIITDLPGIYSLSPYTLEEVVARNYLINESPDAILNVVDGTNLERNLYLTTQLLEIDVPVVIALNMMDVINKEGIELDVKLLERNIGIPVVAISAQTGENIHKLMERAFQSSLEPRKATTVLYKGQLSHLIRDCEISFRALKVDNPLFHSIKLIENDEIESEELESSEGEAEDFEEFEDEDFDNLDEISEEELDAMLDASLEEDKEDDEKEKSGFLGFLKRDKKEDLEEEQEKNAIITFAVSLRKFTAKIRTFADISYKLSTCIACTGFASCTCIFCKRRPRLSAELFQST